MKRNFTFSVRLFTVVAVMCLSLTTFSQLNNSGFHAHFGVDADTKSDYIKFGAVTGGVDSDDWFGGPSSRGVIDTSNTSLYKTNLMVGNNVSFSRRMSVPLYYKANNTMWMDAIYSRDYIKKDSSSPDRTGFVSSAGNLDDPGTWKGGASDVATKTDMVDVFAHMRRMGTSIKDSLWLFTAVSTLGTTGSRYFDIELYKNRLSYNPMTGVFSTGGLDEGHVQWKFDAAGNVTQTGDIIIGVTYSPGSAPTIEVRIWVAKSTFTSGTPALFNFGSNFDAYSNKSLYGYGNIVSKTGTTAFGSGAGNYSATTNDTTFSTPWGTNSKGWSPHYESLQLVEIGINLSRIGVDPALYSTLGTSACGAFFKSILFKSRTSGSFSSNLIDFVGPLDFLNIPTLDHTLAGDTLSCSMPLGSLNITSRTTAGAYTWKALNGGNIVDANADSSSLTINKPGKYVIQGAVATGCPITRRDTITVLADSLQPVASAVIGSDNYGRSQLFGGDTIASNYATRFGGSQGLTWDWTGPSGFTSNIQNPYINNNWGMYTLTVTEKRNGCTSTASVFANFSLLAENSLRLSAARNGSSVWLKWEHANLEGSVFEIERAASNGAYTRIGSVAATAGRDYSFADKKPLSGKNTYRIKVVAENGVIYYSNVVLLEDQVTSEIISQAAGNKLYLVANATGPSKATVVISNMAGALLSKLEVQLKNGHSTTEIPTGRVGRNQVAVISVFIENEPVFSRKVLFSH